MRQKGDLSDFEGVVVVGARLGALGVSGTVDLLEFSHTIFTEKTKYSETSSSLGESQRSLVNVRGQRRMTRL